MQELSIIYSTENISKKNFDKLKNHYGESFAKKIRELFQEYLDKQDFITQINKIIPNKKNDPLRTLNDNINYIISFLAETYKDENENNVVIDNSETKSPVELAINAGYELIGPITSTEGVETFKKDFRHRENLCTFNDIPSRLEAYHILWLRHVNVENILPADELTQDNISEEWKKYLKDRGRYDETSNTFNLIGLKPEREDPYGTSSMSVQVSKTGSHISIKNRYNHTVTNPDATHSNNLDSVEPGLKTALYMSLERDDLLKADSTALADNYVKDNEGGIHPYLFEKNNIYYCEYEKIHDGIVTSINPDHYHMFSPHFYLKKGHSRNEFIVWEDNTFDEIEIKSLNNNLESTDTCFELYCKKSDTVVCEYTYWTDKQNRINKMEVKVTGQLEYIACNPKIVKIEVSNGAKVEIVTLNNSLKELTIGEESTVGQICNNPSLREIKVREKSFVEAINTNPSLQKVVVEKVSTVKKIANNDSLQEIIIEEGAISEKIYQNNSLQEIIIEKNATINAINTNPSLQKVVVKKGSTVKEIADNDSLQEIIIEEGAVVEEITLNDSLQKLTIHDGARVVNINYNSLLKEIEIYGNPSIENTSAIIKRLAKPS